MRGSGWGDFWDELQCQTVTFAELGLSPHAKDDVVWNEIRARDAILITGNRNSDGPISLGAMIRLPESCMAMPVMTISAPTRIWHSKTYVNEIVSKLFEYLLDIENLRGTGRLYLP